MATSKNPFSSEFTPEEVKKWKINSGRTGLFPTDNSERKEFIFIRTGYAADRKNLTTRDWYCFNTSINKALDTGLSDHTLKVLSLMDQALHTSPRFIGVPGMPRDRVDSTAGHSKQVMNIIQYVFDTCIKDPLAKLRVTSLRQNALLGAWLHDMGEIVCELTTAGDMFEMSPEERKEVKEKKDLIENKVFAFACKLAEKCVDENTPELFMEKIRAIRQETLLAAPEDQTLKESSDTERGVKIRLRMRKLEAAIDREIASMKLPETPSPATKHLFDVYEKAEGIISKDAPEQEQKQTVFLHAFIKTLESTEGLRYMQRNGFISELHTLAQLLGPEHAQHTDRKFLSDHEIVEGARRSEKKLHALFDNAQTAEEEKLAMGAASFTYRSIARQFTPEEHDEVGITADLLNRNPPPPSGQTLTGGKKTGPVLIGRKEIGAIYRAAEELVATGAFRPQKLSLPHGKERTACLLSYADTPTIPEQLIKRAKDIQSNPSITNLLFSPTGNSQSPDL